MQAAPYEAEEAHPLYCFDVLSSHFANQTPPPPPFRTDVSCPLFVTWNKQQGRSGHLQLRGCIGCLRPLAITSLRDYSLTSALHDRRFAPMEHHELPRLHCTVQLLGVFEPCALFDWTIGVHGVTISFVERGTARSAVYLPDVIPEQGWTKVEAIDSLIRKSGCEAPITDALRQTLEVQRFVSTKCSVSYEQWAAWRSQANTTPRSSPNTPPLMPAPSRGAPSGQQQPPLHVPVPITRPGAAAAAVATDQAAATAAPGDDGEDSTSRSGPLRCW